MTERRALVTGAGGFIGSHLVRFLKAKGYWIRGVDIKHPEFWETSADEFLVRDLRRWDDSLEATAHVDHVYNLAANMGGIGFISQVAAEVMHDNVLINSHVAEAARQNGATRVFFSSSACVYPTFLQEETGNVGLKEQDAYPADPDNEYGWEKLFSERLYAGYYRDYGLETRIGRFHNIFGPYGTYEGGREKAPAAICRKIAVANDGDEIEVWGDGKQTRSFCYVGDCVEAVYRLMMSDYRSPLNVGSDRLVTIDELTDMVIRIAGKRLSKKHALNEPQGVRGRNSENSLIRTVLDWEPSISLEDGLAHTYGWIAEKVRTPALA